MFLPWIGLEVAFVCAMYTYTFSTLTSEHFLLELLMIHAAYGLDRLADFHDGTSNEEITSFIAKHQKSVEATITASTILSLMALPLPEAICFLGASIHYRDIKKLIPGIKPFFVAGCLTWVSLLHAEGNPMPMILNMFAASNYQDILSVEEDSSTGVQSLPVVFGKPVASGFTTLATVGAAAFASGIHPMTPPLALFQLQNAGFGIRSVIKPGMTRPTLSL